MWARGVTTCPPLYDMEEETMTLWKIYDESVDMVEMRYRFLPSLFRWRGRLYRVELVEGTWDVSRRILGNPRQRRYYQVQAAGSTFEIFQDLLRGTWHLRRARLCAARVPAVRGTTPAWQQRA
jgi:hypothetical protein